MFISLRDNDNLVINYNESLHDVKLKVLSIYLFVALARVIFEMIIGDVERIKHDVNFVFINVHIPLIRKNGILQKLVLESQG